MSNHAAPQARSGVGPWALWFGVLAAPLAWSAHELLSYGFASFLCGVQLEKSTGQAYALSAPFVLLTAGLLALALAGGWIAMRNWRIVRQAPSAQRLRIPDIEAERSGFLARCGLINSLVFLFAFLFTTAGLAVAPLCSS